MLALFLVLPVLIMLWRWRGLRAIGILFLRILTISLLILAVADPTFGQKPSSLGPTIVLVDQSDSLRPEGKLKLREIAHHIAPSSANEVGMVPQDQSGGLDANNPDSTSPPLLLWFGDEVVVAGAYDAAGGVAAGLNDALVPSASNIAEALKTARQILATQSGDIILISDGMQNNGDALYEAEKLAQQGITIDVLPIAPVWTPDVRISDMEVPQSLRMGEEYEVHITIENRQPETNPNMQPVGGLLQLWISEPSDNGQERLIGKEEVTLFPGFNHFTFHHSANSSGVVKLRANIRNVADDSFTHNNNGAATTVVAQPPRILIVEGEDGIGQALSAALWPIIESDVMPAQNLPSRLSQLQLYDGIILLDVSAYNLSLDQTTTIQEFVRSEGRGLLVIGGRNSYSLGAYRDTPLEELLPINLDPPPRPDRSDIALLLMMDRSASMSIPIDVSKFAMAKEAAILSTELLQSQDTIGILAFDTRQNWTIPFQTVGEGLSLKQIQDTIVTLDIGGGTDIYGALEEGLENLLLQNASVRHAVILTDGRSFSNDEVEYEQLVRTARNNDITISSIAIGIDSDTELLDQLSKWGNGRYYYADKPEDIPRLTIQESEIARADPIVEGELHAQLAQAHPILRTINVAQIPNMQGYIATTPRDHAEIVLKTTGNDGQDGDPLLATWQYGLGRVVAWTSSAGADSWTTGWEDWGEYGTFWTQIIRYILPEPESGPIQIHTETIQDGVRLMVDAFEAGGTPLLADAVARITLPDGTQQEFALHQEAPGHYTQDLILPTAGAYKIEALLLRDEQQWFAETGYAHPIPQEYNPDKAYNPLDENMPSYPQGRALLEDIATITGGSVIEDESALVMEQQDDRQEEEDMLSPSSFAWLRYTYWPWLTVLALLVWLIEVGFRRRGL